MKTCGFCGKQAKGSASWSDGTNSFALCHSDEDKLFSGRTCYETFTSSLKAAEVRKMIITGQCTKDEYCQVPYHVELFRTAEWNKYPLHGQKITTWREHI